MSLIKTRPRDLQRQLWGLSVGFSLTHGLPIHFYIEYLQGEC